MDDWPLPTCRCKREARLIPIQPPLVKSAILKGGFALLDKGRHALFLVIGREHGVKEPALEAHALRQRRLESTVNRLFRCKNGGARETRDLRGDLERFVQELVVRHDAADEAASLG